MNSSKSEQKSQIELLRVEAAAEIAGIGRSTAYALIGSGHWPVVRIGKSVRVPRTALMAWIDEEVKRQNPDSSLAKSAQLNGNK